MKVEIIAKTSDPLRVAFTAIRRCYSPSHFEDIWFKEFEEYKAKNNDHIRLVKQIVKHGHTSTLEHISFTFAISGLSRSALAQLTRHRIGFSYSVQSQRYVNARKHRFEYITPPSVRDKDKSLSNYWLYQQLMEDAQKVYDSLIASGVKPEDARFVLPNAATTELVLTCNLRAFLDFFSKRNDNTHTQWELATLAMTMQDKIVESEPWTAHLYDSSAPEQVDFDILTLFKTKYVKVSPNLEATEETVWKDDNFIYVLESDGSFNKYNWKGFVEDLTPRQMKKVMEEYYDKK